MKIRLGCSGWDYEDWIGTLYSREIGKGSKLAAYSRVLNTAEINSTFYSYPKQGMVFGWLRYTPEDFVFTAKIPQLITHEKLLDIEKGVEDDLKRFCEIMLPLQGAGKLGCLLIQLPPKLKFDFNLANSFFEVLPEPFEFAIEFREPSWMCEEAWELLREFGIIYTIVDEPLLPPEVKVTYDYAYFRWHGRGRRPWYNYRYAKEELEPWVFKIREVSEQVDIVYGYFNNHYHGYAPENCIEVLEMLGIATPMQEEALSRIREYREKRVLPSVLKTITLATYAGVEQRSREELLRFFMDEDRIKRAQRIKDEEVVIEEISEMEIRAILREYRISIDLENRVILHNCADWNRCVASKSFCKHLGKLMLILPENQARELLSKIHSELEIWEFKPYIEGT